MARRAKFKISTVEQALRETGGIFTAASQMLHCAPNTVKNYVERHPKLQRVLEEVTDVNLDMAEATVIHHVGEKNLTAAMFYLRTKGRGRGYGDKVEVGGKAKVAFIDLSKASLEEVRGWAQWDAEEEDLSSPPTTG